ncbi:MAG: hypothetical protein Ct9H300mP25_17570 [Acidobacteriota bacterium]|nr:MAG: hypothetical protein Ct9H300mP25_17570 [Acidobacteriota bacterium]
MDKLIRRRLARGGYHKPPEWVLENRHELLAETRRQLGEYTALSLVHLCYLPVIFLNRSVLRVPRNPLRVVHPGGSSSLNFPDVVTTFNR